MMRSFLVLAALTMVFGCSSISTSADYDTEFDFGGFKTFRWARPAQSSPAINALVGERIEAAVNADLEAKGYTANSANPDFLVAVHAGKNQKVDIVDWGYGYGGAWGYRGGYRGVGYRGGGGGGVSAYSYEEGELIIDIVNSASKKLVWRGTGTGVVDPNPTPEEITERVNAAVTQILAAFPPK